MTTTTCVHWDVMTAGLTVADVQGFLREAAVLGAQPADAVERVLDENDTDERVVGLRVQGGALSGAASSIVELHRGRLLELHDTLAAVADGDGDARGVRAELARHRDWLRDVLLGR